MGVIEIQPVDYASACEFIRRHHRHHLPPQGWKFGIGATAGDGVVGVVTVGRPVARRLDDGWTYWNVPSRPRVVKAPTEAKTLWEAV